ncbi:hypothetical protein TNCV_3058151 [Trichonephila clavipes]|nr:hypothetical protein TNCV_3058151 [Trichonephila clavipes]
MTGSGQDDCSGMQESRLAVVEASPFIGKFGKGKNDNFIFESLVNRGCLDCEIVVKNGYKAVTSHAVNSGMNGDLSNDTQDSSTSHDTADLRHDEDSVDSEKALNLVSNISLAFMSLSETLSADGIT